MFRHLSKGLILSLLTCAVTPAAAAVVSVEDAKQLAAEFLRAGNNDDLAAGDVLDLAYTAGTANHPYYYVFNARSGKGYVIVSADDTTTPVLGYSTECSYDAASASPAMQWMLSGLASEIKAAPSLSGRYTATQRRNMVRRAARTGERILLETAKWSQESPFNASIPGRRLVGCVGTAMSIIMKYHEWPAHGTGSFNGVSYDVDYDWANMRKDNYRYGYSAEEAAAVSTLMYHAASSIDTQFGMSGSSAYEVRVPGALTNYFGYDPGVTYRKRSEFNSQAAFDAIVIEEIRQQRPVLYCGQDVTVGHAFVVDGYDPVTGMLHINWGWAGADGNFNGGWYASTALNPTVSQSHQFNNLTTIIYNIKPGSGSNSNWSPLHLTSEGGQVGIGSDMTQLAPGKKFTVRAGAIKNVGYNTFSGKIAVALFSAAGEFKSLLSGEQNISLQSVNLRSYIDFYNCELPSGVQVEAGDMVRIATSEAGGNWLPVPGELLTVNELPADRTVIETFAVNFPPAIAGISWNGEKSVIKGWNYSFSITPGDPEEDVLTVKANGILLTPAANTYNYSIANVREDQEISILLQKASEVKAKRNIWVDEPGTLSTLISSAETGTITELTLFGQIDARDFEFMRKEMNLQRLDISGAYIAAYGSDQAYAVPRNAFSGKRSLKEVILPNNINRINNGAFSSSGIVTITIPAGVSTYEYNVFLGCNALRDVWVGREKAEFINWCVFSGARTDLMTLHVPNQNAVNNYSAKEYWKDIKNIIIDPIPARTDYAFAVMEDAEVKYDSKTVDGRYEKGTVVNFTARHIADNDNRMVVYANSTPLTADAEGVYTVTLNSNTIVHFDLVKPTPVATYASPWTLTDTGGTVGLLTDAVNVIPGIKFTIRANALNVPADATSMFWAAVLTDSEGNIKEFISPVSSWGGAKGDGLRMNVDCCVKEATVREGNFIRLATSYNMKSWALVGGSNENVIDRLPAINNQTPVYYFSYPENLTQLANVSGNVASAVRGRDITLKVTPKNASYMMDAVINGDTIVKAAKTFTYSYIAKEDIDFDINIYPPVTLKEATIVLAEGEHLYYNGYEGIDNWGQLNYATTMKYKDVEKLKIVGKLDYYDFDFFRNENSYGIATNLKYLDLSEVTLVRERGTTDSHAVDNCFPSYAFKSDVTGGSFIEEIILPSTVRYFDDYAFQGCSRLREIHLPANLRNWTTEYTPSMGTFKNLLRGGLSDNVFDGCKSLETIYLPCVPGEEGKVGHWYYSQYHALKTGLPDNKKVTVVVLPEYLDVYKTPHVDNGYFESRWSNGWEAGGFNLVGEYPVYSLNYDASRLFMADKEFDVEKAASFLRDNISLESISVEGKLFVGALSQAEGRPEGVDGYQEGVNVRLYDNGKLMPAEAVGADGAVNLTFWNPNRHADKSGSHEIKAVYLYDVLFNCASDQFTVTPEIRNNEAEMGDEATEFEVLDSTQASAPVLRNVKEDSSVRFAIGFSTDNQDIRPRVKVGDQVLSADEEGYYTVNVEDADVTVEIYAIPSNGATLTTEEIVSVNPAESADVTSLSLQGEIDEETLAIVVNGFEALSTLDLSGMESEIPANAFEGKTTLTEVILPEVDTILPGTFKDCENLATVTVPETVSTIGAEAFSGCASLEQITLTGIDAIGADAFAGCDNLTSITLNPATGTPVAERAIRCRAPRISGFDENAFKGVNPNCLIILGEGVAVPATAAGNYLASRVEEVAVAEADVEETALQVRVYESAGDITLRAGYPFAAESAFTMNGDDTISLVTEVPAAADGWKSLVVPFAVEKVAADGVELVAKTAPDQDSAMTDYMVATLVEGDKEIALTAGIAANVPALIRQTKSETAREITVSASGVTVAATPATVKTEGSEYSLCSSYRAATLPASTTYVLNAEGNAFEAIEPATVEEELAEALTEVAPFEVYAVAPAGEDRIAIAVAGDDIITSVDMIGAEGFKVVAEGSDLVIWTADEMETAVYALDGRMIGRITLNPGRNVISGLAGGVYIVEGIKVIL